MGLNTIRRIYDYSNQANVEALSQCKNILLSQFPYMNEQEANELLMAAGQQTSQHFKYLVLIAEGRNKQVLGVAIASHFHKGDFFYLDFIATRQHRLSGGIGGALYERLRDEAESSRAVGIFFECIPDDLKLSLNEEELKQNIARLKFYERYGARPISGTAYETYRADKSVFYLVMDTLAHKDGVTASMGKSIFRSILQSKASKKCTSEYIDGVVQSVKKSLTLRPFKYLRHKEDHPIKTLLPSDKKIGLVVNEGHLIHHVRERGYLESPVRVKSILRELNKLELFESHPPRNYSDTHLEGVHDTNYLKFLKKICTHIGHKETRYGDVFPVRNAARLPGDIELQIGYYCIDTSTPLNANAYIAARGAVNCALTAADLVIQGKHMAYALVRPPGHHAERKYFGGFCYLNSSAVAANYLSKRGKVAILDIDYHHGNGQQDIFYHRSDVFTVSIHGDPEYAYPNFTGFTDETGEGEGIGYNLNLTLPEHTSGKTYHKTLQNALQIIKDYNPAYLVIALGLDIAKGDPTGTWLLSANDFLINGKLISALKFPTVVIQEGGYQNKVLGTNARHFFQGLWNGYYS